MNMNNTIDNGQAIAMPPQLIASKPLSIDEIQDWLAEQIGHQLGIGPESVDTRVSFHSYGLESTQAMAIAQTGQHHFGLEISPLVIWNCPTIETLSRHIARELSEKEQFEV